MVRRFLLFALCVWALDTPVKAAQQPLVIGFNFQMGRSGDAQLWTLLKEVAQTFIAGADAPFTVQLFREREAYDEALQKGALAVAYSPTYNGTPLPLYEKVLAVRVLDMPTYSDCLFVKKDSPFQTVEDLRGKTVFTVNEKIAYLSLRSMTEQPPDDLFTLKTAANGQALFYALSLDKADAVHATDAALRHMLKTNPGPVANLRVLTCSDITHTFPPILLRKDLPPQLKKDVVTFLETARQNKALKRFHPMMKVAGIRFSPVTGEDYAYITTLHERAEKEHWLRDYELWQSGLEAD